MCICTKCRSCSGGVSSLWQSLPLSSKAELLYLASCYWAKVQQTIGVQQEGCKPEGRRWDLRPPFCLQLFRATPQYPCLLPWQGLCFPVTAVESSFQLLQRFQRQCHCSPTITSPPAPPPQRAGSWSHGTTPLMCEVLSNSPPICLCFPSLRGYNCLL